MTSVVKYDLIKEKTRAIKIVFQITILFSDTGAMFSKATQKHATPWNGFHALEKKKATEAVIHAVPVIMSTVK